MAVKLGAAIGLVIGIALSVRVGTRDRRLRDEGRRRGGRPFFTSLFMVPLILAGLGALVGALVG